MPLITGRDAKLWKSRPADHGIGTKSQAAVNQYLASAADPARIAVGETSCYPATISCTCSTRTSEDSWIQPAIYSFRRPRHNFAGPSPARGAKTAKPPRAARRDRRHHRFYKTASPNLG